jgi:2-polyprenyl-6-methoxyphenol hydroxylase-like FAD-dependent oxidoreductase
MPQWDFLDFLSGKARKFSNFDLRMQHEAVGLVRDGDRIVGVEVQTPDGPTEIRADLVVGCDGRHSIIRKAAQLELIEFGVPIDVLWFHISRRGNDPEQLLGNINYGRPLVPYRGDYWQCAFVIPKGGAEELQRRPIEVFREQVVATAPLLRPHIGDVGSWRDVKLLTVAVDRLTQWSKPGLLCIGDAAHAMSPVGGVGINLAIQDAVAAANILAGPLGARRATAAHLRRVQRRREFPTRVTQWVQARAHKVFDRLFQNPGPAKPPWQLKLATSVPGVQRLLARAVGMGVRPEHIREAGVGAVEKAA